MTATLPPLPSAVPWPWADGEMAERVRRHAWASTALGPLDGWPGSLRAAVQIALSHPFPTIVLWGPQLVQVYNDGYRALMGSRHPAGLGQPSRDCWPEVWHINAPVYERVWRGEPVSLQDAPFPVSRGDGTREDAWFTLSYSPLRDDAGTVAGIFLTVIETTARVRAEQAERESERRLRLAMSVGQLATWDWDVATGKVVWSAEHYQMQGYRPGEIEPSYEAWLARVHPDDRARAESALAEARAGRAEYDHEFRIRLPDGTVRWASAQGRFFFDGQGRAVRMIGVMRDVTEQRGARELLESKVRERTYALRQLLLRIENVQDDERRRLARELHDGLGQHLSSVAMALGALRERPHDAIEEQLQRLHALMQQLDGELDRIVFTLRPTSLDDCGLAEAVAAFVQSWSQLSGVAVDLELHGFDAGRLPAPVEAAVLRVVQEALTNVAKYARAKQVAVRLERRRGQLVGSVEDDGVGFDPAELGPASGRTRWGLMGMQERVEALGGSFEIESQPTGTAVLWRLPV